MLHSGRARPSRTGRRAPAPAVSTGPRGKIPCAASRAAARCAPLPPTSSRLGRRRRARRDATAVEGPPEQRRQRPKNGISWSRDRSKFVPLVVTNRTRRAQEFGHDAPPSERSHAVQRPRACALAHSPRKSEEPPQTPPAASNRGMAAWHFSATASTDVSTDVALGVAHRLTGHVSPGEIDYWYVETCPLDRQSSSNDNASPLLRGRQTAVAACTIHFPSRRNV